MKRRAPLNIGVVGLGPRGRDLAKLLKLIKICRLTALCEKVEPLLVQACRELRDPSIQRFTDFDSFLKNAPLDAVLFSTAPHERVDLICQALEHGKHVLSEVPFALTLRDCWRIVLAVEKSGMKYQMAVQGIFAPWVAPWTQMVRDGSFGKVLYVEGQYLHGLPEKRFFNDAVTGQQIHRSEARRRRSVKSRFWQMPHAIHYLAHSLAPALRILDDRVDRVTCMGSRRPSYVHPWFPFSDFEAALMHTTKGTLLRMTAGLTIDRGPADIHRFRLEGTRGWIEQPLIKGDKSRLWFSKQNRSLAVEVEWKLSPSNSPTEALKSGHGGLDYFPLWTFAESILKDKPTAMDVYAAADTAAPAILAGHSADHANRCFRVPEFRPNKTRRAGHSPRSMQPSVYTQDMN